MALPLQPGDPVPRLVLEGAALAVADFAGRYLALVVGERPEVAAALSAAVAATADIGSLAWLGVAPPAGTGQAADHSETRSMLRADPDGLTALRLGARGDGALEPMIVLVDPRGAVVRVWAAEDLATAWPQVAAEVRRRIA